MPVILLTAGLGGQPVHADSSGKPVWTCSEQLAGLGECELEQVFAQADAGPIPVGSCRGHVLLMTNTKRPRARARMANCVWKGKVFGDCGCFINQWCGFQAISSQAVLGASWLDGKPCIFMEYAPGTPIFANTRDEIRQIGPNLYLGRFYDRCPCPKVRGYFVLQFDCSNCCSH
jgi:hypothetical protein